MVDEIHGEVLARADAQSRGEDDEVAQLGVQDLAVVLEVRGATEIALVVLEAGLPEAPVDPVVRMSVAGAEGQAERQRRLRPGLEFVGGAEVDAPPVDSLRPIPAPAYPISSQ